MNLTRIEEYAVRMQVPDGIINLFDGWANAMEFAGLPRDTPSIGSEAVGAMIKLEAKLRVMMAEAMIQEEQKVRIPSPSPYPSYNSLY